MRELANVRIKRLTIKHHNQVLIDTVHFPCVVQISSYCEFLLDKKSLIFYLTLSENDRVPVPAMLFLLVLAGTGTLKNRGYSRNYQLEPSSSAP
jgi:hypothetical protein